MFAIEPPGAADDGNSSIEAQAVAPRAGFVVGQSGFPVRRHHDGNEQPIDGAACAWQLEGGQRRLDFREVKHFTTGADHLHGARIHAEFFDGQIAWETRCTDQVLKALDGPVVLLKGAAYRALEMGLSKGRLASDVDLLLPREQLPAAEALLEADGWAPIKEDEYDQHYYREWMHELPPLRHQDRGTVIDLHHNILPPTARFKPDARKLLDAAVPISGTSLFALSPADTVLHRCAHLFVDGDLHNSLRELMDIYGLLSFYEQDVSFRETLLPRARELQLQRPLGYALYFCARLLQWQPPAEWAPRGAGVRSPDATRTRATAGPSSAAAATRPGLHVSGRVGRGR